MQYPELMIHLKKTVKTERMGNTFEYNEGVRKSWTPIWSRYAAVSYESIRKRFEDKDCDMKTIPHVENKPCIILGSGPSLDDVLPYLKDWQGDIFCSTSQLGILEHYGIEPTYCVLIDADPKMIYLVTDYRKDNPTPPKTIFITHPQVPSEYIDAWKGEIRFFRMFDPGDDLSAKYIPHMYGWINTKTNWHIGSYILNSGNVVNSIIPLASALGYNPIFLCGYDLGYPEKVYRGMSARVEDGKLALKPAIPLADVNPPRITKPGNNGVLTDDLCTFYKYSFMIMYGLGNPPLISCSRGILSELPYADPKEVVENQGKGYVPRSPAECYRIAQTYLKPRNIYLLRTDYFFETVNMYAKKGWYNKLQHVLHWYWYNSRPWKWLGGRGWVPRFIKRQIIEQTRKEVEAKLKQKVVMEAK